jgi:endo-1,4-beta-xylanase
MFGGDGMKLCRRVHRRVLLSGLVALGLTACEGGMPTPTPALAPMPTPTSSLAPSDGTFYWKSSAPLIAPQADPFQTVYSVKDPSVVFVNGKYHVFMTTAGSKGWGIAYTSFADWSSASTAPIFPLDKSPIGPGYRAAPEVFYFAPQKLWYLIFQGGDPLYSTTANIDDPMSWSPARPFFATAPYITKPPAGTGWLDFYIICNDTKCYLFNTDDNGHVMRSETSIDQFPNGFHNTVIVISEPRDDAFEGSSHYRVKGTNTYLTVVEAISTRGRYFRIWKSDGLEGAWVPLGTAAKNPFATAGNVESIWSEGISHGELIRDTNDQTQVIDPCKPLQFLFQGNDPLVHPSDYIQLPYRLGVLTANGSNPITDMCRQ